MTLLTVVVPAYNVQTYIGRCIESVLCQSNATSLIELIVVVDGATDNTFMVVQAIAQRFVGRIQVIVQENQGLSAARNVGVGLTSSEYVTFLDGDDIWLPDFLDTTLPTLVDGAVDLVEYDAQLIDESDRPLSLMKIASAAPGEIEPANQDSLLALFRCYAWARIYRTSLVRSRLYPRGRRFEDTATTPWHYWNSHRTLSLGHALIGYRQHPQSILAKPLPQDIEDITLTTAQAAEMYAVTGSPYWQRVTHLTFQQACRRLTGLPLGTWPRASRGARAAAAKVPPPPGVARWLQVHATLFYVVMLYVKRILTRS